MENKFNNAYWKTILNHLLYEPKLVPADKKLALIAFNEALHAFSIDWPDKRICFEILDNNRTGYLLVEKEEGTETLTELPVSMLSEICYRLGLRYFEIPGILETQYKELFQLALQQGLPDIEEIEMPYEEVETPARADESFGVSNDSLRLAAGILYLSCLSALTGIAFLYLYDRRRMHV